MDEKNKDLLALLHRLEALVRRAAAQGLGRRGPAANPHRGQGRVLSLLKLQPKITQRELGYLLDMRGQSLGELLTKLERSGYITRTPSEEDRRMMVIELTEEGAKAAEALDESEGEMDNLFDALSGEEQDELYRLLEKLCLSFEEKYGAEPPPYYGHHGGKGRPFGPGGGSFAGRFTPGGHGFEVFWGRGFAGAKTGFPGGAPTGEAEEEDDFSAPCGHPGPNCDEEE